MAKILTSAKNGGARRRLINNLIKIFPTNFTNYHKKKRFNIREHDVDKSTLQVHHGGFDKQKKRLKFATANTEKHLFNNNTAFKRKLRLYF